MGKLRKSLIKGTIYTGVAKYSGLIVSLLVTAILSRSLQPQDFGTVAIATFFINFFSTLTISGFSPAIVQNRELDERDIENIYSFTVLLGFMFSLAFALLSHTIADYYEGNIYLEKICYLLSVNIFFSVICIVPNAILLKEKQFKFISMRMLIVNVAGGLLSVLAIFIHWGIFALVVNPIFSSIVIFLITIRKRPITYHIKYKWDSIQKILNYSVYQMLFNFVYLIYRGLDKLIIGKSFDLKMLGYYEKSYRLMMLPLENVTGVITPVLHPILSDIQNDHNRVYDSYLKIVKFLSEIGFLLTAYIVFNARELILLIFGSQWEPSVPVFQILAASIGIQIAQSPVGPILQTFNKVKELFYCSVACLLLVTLALAAGVFTGSLYFLSLYLTGTYYLIFIVYNMVICRMSGHHIGTVIKSTLIAVIKALLLFVLLFFIDNITSQYNMLLTLALKTILSLMYFAAALYMGLYNDIPLPHFIARRLKHYHQ